MPPRKKANSKKGKDEKSPANKSAAVKNKKLEQLIDIAMKLRIDSINMCEASKSGHPTTCSSIAEIMAALFFDPAGMQYDPQHPENMLNDRLILSKGHAAPILCNLFIIFRRCLG
jgi:transketolase